MESTTVESTIMDSFYLFLDYRRFDSLKNFSQILDYWSYDSLKNFSQISPVVQTHLKLAYVKLCCYYIAIAAGAYLHMVWNIGGLLTTFATLGCMLWLLATPPCEEPVSVLTAFFLFQGASLNPVIKLAIDFDPRILVSGFIGGAIIAACFSGAATLATRRQFLYLGGILSSGVLLYFWSHVASKIFGGEVALFRFELYSGLLISVGCMVVQSQVLILNILIEEFGWESDEEDADADEDEEEEEEEDEEEEEGE